MGIAVQNIVRDIQPVFEVLLRRGPNGFRNNHLAQALGASPLRVPRLLEQEDHFRANAQGWPGYLTWMAPNMPMLS